MNPVQDRVSFVAGDYNKDELHGGCDLALLSAVVHQNSPEQSLNLFQKIYRDEKPKQSEQLQLMVIR